MAPMVQILKQFNDCPDSEDSRLSSSKLKGDFLYVDPLCRLAQIKGDKALTLPV